MCLKCTEPFTVEINNNKAGSYGSHLSELQNLSKRNGVVIAHLNVNSLLSKLDDNELLIHSGRIKVLCVSETKLDSTISDNTVTVLGYKFFRKDRSRHGGGVGIYISSSLKSSTCRPFTQSLTALEYVSVVVHLCRGRRSVLYHIRQRDSFAERPSPPQNLKKSVSTFKVCIREHDPLFAGNLR